MHRTRNHKRTINHSVDGIRDHAVGMKENVRDIGEAVKDVLIERFTDMLKRAVSFGDRTQQFARDTAGDVRDDLEERIQAKPYRAVLIAAGLGLMLGVVLRRR